VENDGFRNELSAYKDGELDEDLSEEISLHLRNCAACRKELAELERVDSLIKDMPKLDLDDSFFLQIIAGISTKEQDRHDSAPSSKRVFARFLQLADSIFELVSGHEYERTATLDEFSDFPPLSMSHAYFQLIGEQR
jgi:anti-sigma factor RsiW